MKKITGNYIKGKSEIPFSADIPSSWSELEKKQFSRIIEVLNYRKADRFTISVSLLALLFGPKNFHVLDGLPDDLLNSLVPLTNFLFEEKPPVQNFFPGIKVKKRMLIAPADDLSNLCFGEWCFAHQFFIYYSLTQDKIWLDKLIATIYRPKDSDQNPESPTYSGDMREVFNEKLIEKRAHSVAHIEHHLKIAILTWFGCAVSEVAESRPHVFPPAPEADPQNPEPPKEMEPPTTNWLTIFRELLGPKWGTTEELKFTNAMFILDELEDRHIAYEQAKNSA